MDIGSSFHSEFWLLTYIKPVSIQEDTLELDIKRATGNQRFTDKLTFTPTSLALNQLVASMLDQNLRSFLSRTSPQTTNQTSQSLQWKRRWLYLDHES